VKPFSLLKITMVTLGFGALMVFAPSCKAQSEVSPDHFDGTDAWEVAARKPVSPKPRTASGPAVYQAQKAKANASLQLASARENSNAVPRNALALQDKKKPAVRKSDKE